ncbi:hypothetical protein PHISCL_10971, partial [Aspergillus sclerotialis]
LDVEQCANNFPRLLLAALLHEPAWRFGQHKDEGHHNKGDDDLECKRESPGYRAILDEEKAEINPQSEGCSDTDVNAIRDNVRASFMRFRQF